jgi:hypothetical protein
MGNYSGATGYIGDPGNIDELVRQKEVSETEKDKIFYKKGINFIIENPSEVFMLSLKKFVLYWNPLVEDCAGPSYIRNKNINYKSIIAVSFSCLILFGIIGVFCISDLWKKTRLLLMLLMYFSMVSMIFYVSLRYRQPIIPVLGLFAGKGIGCSFSLLNRKMSRLFREKG